MLLALAEATGSRALVLPCGALDHTPLASPTSGDSAWRVPFLESIVLVIVGLIIRAKVPRRGWFENVIVCRICG